MPAFSTVANRGSILLEFKFTHLTSFLASSFFSLLLFFSFWSSSAHVSTVR